MRKADTQGPTCAGTPWMLGSSSDGPYDGSEPATLHACYGLSAHFSLQIDFEGSWEQG